MTASTNILALNLGSSSLKYAFYKAADDDAQRNQCELLGSKISLPINIVSGPSHAANDLVSQVALNLPGEEYHPNLIAHRIVHGSNFSHPIELTKSATLELEKLNTLAPLHQPQALALAHAAMRKWPNAKHVAVFDTSWHATLADWSRTLPLPLQLRKLGIQRFGFHGLAFQSAMRELRANYATSNTKRIVLAHLGSGCSLCAVKDGVSLDTTMGMTPLDGLPMSQRVGALDAGIIFYLHRNHGFSVDEIEQLLWNKSGLLGISNTSGDMKQLLATHSNESELAVAQFVMRVAQGIAAMTASLGGIDGLVFSGGIGTHSAIIRELIVSKLAWMGLRLDEAANINGNQIVSTLDSSAVIWRLEADEEYEIAASALSLSQSANSS